MNGRAATEKAGSGTEKKEDQEVKKKKGQGED
jgi:hypothetical protein